MGGGAFPAISTREPWDGKDGEVSPGPGTHGDSGLGSSSPAFYLPGPKHLCPLQAQSYQ